MDSTSGLLTGTASGSQSNTQNPQTSAQANGPSTASTAAIQPVVTGNFLAGSNGIQLQNNNLSSISLTAATPLSQTNHIPVSRQAINPILLGLVVLLFMVAIIMFTAITRSAKSTTKSLI